MEDFTPRFTEPPPIIRQYELELMAEHAKPKPHRYIDLYRKYRDPLRAILTDPKVDPDDHDHAARCLREISLLQTRPWNEADTPDFIDGYTGHISLPGVMPDLDDVLDQMNEIGEEALIQAVLDLERYDTAQARLLDPTNTLRITPFTKTLDELAERFCEVYEDPDMRAAAIAANLEHVRAHPDDEPAEDRGYVPDTFSEDGTDFDLHALRNIVRPLADQLRSVISAAIRDHGKYATIAIRDAVSASEPAVKYLAQLSGLAAHQNPDNVAALFAEFQHGYAFSIQDARRVRMPPYTLYDWLLENFRITPEDDDRLELPEYDAGRVAFPKSGSLIATLDDLMAGGDAASRRDLSDAEIEEIVDRDFEQYLSQLDDHARSPVQTRAWSSAYIRAMIATGQPGEAKSAGWDAWCQSISPKGAAQRRNILAHGGSPKAAIAAFYRIARSEGALLPTRPKVVKALRPTGLLLSTDRFIDWRTAAKIARAEGFADAQRLKDALIAHGIGQALVASL